MDIQFIVERYKNVIMKKKKEKRKMKERERTVDRAAGPFGKML